MSTWTTNPIERDRKRKNERMTKRERIRKTTKKKKKKKIVLYRGGTGIDNKQQFLCRYRS